MANKKYPDELKDRAVRLVLAARDEPGGRRGACARVAQQLGLSPDSLRKWVAQAEIDRGVRPGTTTDDATRLAELEREVRELRRANAILKSASAFFAAELAPPRSDSRLHRHQQARIRGRADLQGTAGRPVELLRSA
ncbi:transposase [Glaciihabitans tibetensis]|uniref:Transposase n=1 Tax=Glaciihabitans tibetensis TaxID=1266600 RepID=A0A2T0V3J5_9MICO|nr:transposase [Glaciihabitans tibetensis]